VTFGNAEGHPERRAKDLVSANFQVIAPSATPKVILSAPRAGSQQYSAVFWRLPYNRLGIHAIPLSLD
jgi:hypothetical protein